MNITIVGFGYVGISNAILLDKENKICIYDIDGAKVRSVNSGHTLSIPMILPQPYPS